jgi:transcriptional regulator with XRE-family HTH domain
MAINVIITENIRKILEKKGWKQVDLANSINRPASSIQNIYSDITKDPKITLLLAISRGLNVSIYDLVGYENIDAEHKEFYKKIIIEVKNTAKNLAIELDEEKKSMVVNELYQLAKQEAGADKKAELIIDGTYLHFLLNSSNQP